MSVYKRLSITLLMIALLATGLRPAIAQETSPLASPQPVQGEERSKELVTGQTFKGLPFISQRLDSLNFADTRKHWSFAPVLRLASQGLISAYNKGRFAPEEKVTREEALSLLLRVAGLEAATPSLPGWQNVMFGQVNPTVALAAASGLLAGREMAFTPEEWRLPAQRQEVATWVGRTLGLVPVAGGVYPNLAGFADGCDVDRELAPWVEAVLQKGFLAGVKPGVFAPGEAMKRGQLAALLDRIDNQLAYRRGAWRVEGQVVDRVETWLNNGELLVTLRVASFAGPIINLEITVAAGGSPGIDFIVAKDGSFTFGQKLTPGDPVRLILQGEHVLLAEVLSDRQDLTGTILSTANGELVLLDYEGRQFRYPASSLAATGSYTGTLVPGQEVNLTVHNGLVTQVVPLPGTATPAYDRSPTGFITGYLREIKDDEIAVATGPGGETVLKVNGATTISRGGRPLALNDLKIGDNIKVSFDAARQALEIQVSNSSSRIASVVKGKLDRSNIQDGRVVLRDVSEFFYGTWMPSATLQLVSLTREAAAFLGAGTEPLAKSNRSAGEVVVAMASGSQGEVGRQAIGITSTTRTYQGYLDELSLGAGELLLANEREPFSFTPESVVIKNGQLVEATDLEQGDYLFMVATPAANGRQAVLVVTEDVLPPSWRLYRGQIESVTREGFVVKDGEELSGAKFRQYDWQETEDDELEFQLAWEPVIYDNGVPLSREEFTASRFTDKYHGYKAYTLARGNEARGLLLLPKESIGPTMTSLGRLTEIDRSSGRITVEGVRDWSSGYRNWQNNDIPLVLATEAALVMKGRDTAVLEDINRGDNVYLVHDRRKALLVVVSD